MRGAPLIPWLVSAVAAGVAVAPSDGVAVTGPRRPAWTLHGEPYAPRTDFDVLARELDLAWAERRALENEAARRRVDRVVAELGIILDAGERDLLQRALFLRGMLDVDEAGGLEALRMGVEVGGRVVPAAWVAAIARSPGSPAPATTDAAYAGHVYEQARTALVEAGGLTLDASAPGAGEVRVDGLPVTRELVLLPGPHTLSWHPVGAPPVVLAVYVRQGPAPGEGQDAAALGDWLSRLASVGRDDEALAADLRGALMDGLKAPAVVVASERGARRVWLVDGPARWGRPSLQVGVGVGAWALSSAETAAVACDGTVASPDQALGLGGPEVSLTLGALRLRAAGGALQALGGGFATQAPGTCADGVTPNVVMTSTFGWGGGGVGYRIGLGQASELEPFVRGGATGVHAFVQAGAAVRLDVGRSDLELRAFAGPAFNAWSGGAIRFALATGAETAILFGGG